MFIFGTNTSSQRPQAHPQNTNTSQKPQTKERNGHHFKSEGKGGRKWKGLFGCDQVAFISVTLKQEERRRERFSALAVAVGSRAVLAGVLV